MILQFDEFEFEPERLELRRAGKALSVDLTQLRLLAVLASNAGKLVTKRELHEQVWCGRTLSESAIPVAMVRLRKALGDNAGDHKFVRTVYGHGYRFVAPVKLVVSPARAPQLLPAEQLKPPPFVGHEGVLHALHAALAEVNASAGRAWVLTGEPGIGKTRLVEEFEREAIQAGALVVWVHFEGTDDAPPLWPFAQILRQVLRRSASHELDVSAREWAERVPELAMLLPEWRQQEASPAHAFSWTWPSQHRIFDAIIQIMSRASKLRPYVIVLDDLHRADASSLELLQRFIDLLQRTKIMLVATLNCFDVELATARAHLAYLCGHRNTSRVNLPRLSEAEVISYVSVLLDDPGGVLGRTVYQKCEGNPFFMRELAHQLKGTENADAIELAVPSAALELLRRCIASLNGETRDALSWAAVIGRRFELRVLQRVSGHNPCRIMDLLEPALSRSIVVSEFDSRTVLKFAHEFWRVALYEALTPAKRRTFHRAVAIALEDHSSSGASVTSADLAFHHHAGLPASDLQKTVYYCRTAANDSMKRFAYADALRYLRYAHEAVDLMERPSPRLRLNLMMLEALCARSCSAAEFESLARDHDESTVARGVEQATSLCRSSARKLGGTVPEQRHEVSALKKLHRPTQSSVIIFPNRGLRWTRR